LNDDQSHVVWQGVSWRLRVTPFPLPDGRILERGAIEHPGSVVLVPLLGQGPQFEVLMLRQYRFALQETILELPAGTRDWDEDWLACARRELREETGYAAARFTQLGSIWPAPGLSDESMALYLAQELRKDPLPADADEVIEVQPMPLDMLVKMAKDGRLRDGKSIVGIMRAAVHLGIW